MGLKKCLFCSPEIISEGLLDESSSFYHRANVVGAIAPGHSMIISKRHYSCFGEMPEHLEEEYLDMLSTIKRRIREKFSSPVLLVEQGIHGQSVNHAHTHFLPAVSEWYDFTKERKFSDFIPQEIPVTLGYGLREIREIFNQEGQYVTIEENGLLRICHTQNYRQRLRPARDFTCALTGITELLNWQTMSDSEKEKNKNWVKETIRRLRVKG
jgi:diadenosine tetraphosphate (Ap4A) HIT family hydrolase